MKYENPDLLAQVREQRQRWLDAVSSIRQDFIDEDKIFFDQRDDKESIGDSTFFNVVWAYMARTYTERPVSLFEAKQFNQMQKAFVDKLNAVKDTDLESEDFENARFQMKFDTYRYGAGILAMTGWDWNTKKPILEVVKPSCVVPDPDGDYVSKVYDYIGFETQKRKSQLPEEYDIDALSFQANLDANKVSEKSAANMLSIGNDQNNPIYDVYYHFCNYAEENEDGTKWDTKKYLVVTGNNDSVIVYLEELPVVTAEETKDNTLVPFPVLVNNWRPDRNSIFGQRLATVCKNIQIAITLIQNLRYKKDKAELYPMYLYNTRLIKRPADLDMWFNKFIATNPDENENINNAIAPFPKDVRSDNSASIEAMLNQNLTRSTGGINSNITQGTTPETRETATVQKMVQANTDVNVALDDKIQSWFDKDFLKLWLRSYLENFKDGDKKIARIKTGMGFIQQELTKDQFLSYVEVSITVITKSEKDQKEAKESVALTNSFAILQGIERPKIAQDLHAREVLQVNGIDLQKANLFVPLSPQEMIADQENMLLNQGINIPINDTDDHLTHLILHDGTLETVAAAIHKQAHIDAYTRIQDAQPMMDPGMVQASESANNIQSSMAWANASAQAAQVQKESAQPF